MRRDSTSSARCAFRSSASSDSPGWIPLRPERREQHPQDALVGEKIIRYPYRSMGVIIGRCLAARPCSASRRCSAGGEPWPACVAAASGSCMVGSSIRFFARVPGSGRSGGGRQRGRVLASKTCSHRACSPRPSILTSCPARSTVFSTRRRTGGNRRRVRSQPLRTRTTPGPRGPGPRPKRCAMRAAIAGTGYYVPGPPITNDELIARYRLRIKPYFVRRSIGVETRHFADSEHATSDLATEAADRAIASSRFPPPRSVGSSSPPSPATTRPPRRVASSSATWGSRVVPRSTSWVRARASSRPWTSARAVSRREKARSW